MVEPTPSSELDALIEAARRAAPDALTPLDARRMVKGALHEAARRREVRRRRLQQVSCAALACALIVAFLWLHPRDTAIELARDAVPLRLSLKTGDSLLIAAGTRLKVLDDAAPKRAIELERGTVLFDVSRLGAGSSFEVQTHDAQVRVLGTVFSVSVEADHTHVHVHEGKVSVGGRTLRANQAWASSGTIASPHIPFEREARAWVLARSPSSALHAPNAVRAPAPVVSAWGAAGQDADSSRTARESAQVADGQSAARPSVDRASVSHSPVASMGSQPYADRAQRESKWQRGDASAEASQAAYDAAFDWLVLGRRELVRGEAERALALANAHGESAAGTRLAADALRALGRFEEALVQYELAALRSSGALRAQAGYGAAQLAFGSLHDGARALALIERFELDAEGAPLRERSSLLRVESLLALGRKSEALSAARHYLEREPATATSQRLRTLFEGAL